MDVLKSSYTTDSDDSDDKTDEPDTGLTDETFTNITAGDNVNRVTKDWECTQCGISDKSNTLRDGLSKKTDIVNHEESEIQEVHTETTERNPGAADNKMDFFGLASSDNNSNDPDEVINKAEVEVKEDKHEVVSLKGTSVKVEIPNTSFWSQLDKSEIQAYQRDNDLSGSLKRRNVHKQGIPHKRVVIEQKDCRIPTDGSQKHFDNHAHFKQLGNKDSTSKQERKLFYVHNKVKPYLHTHNSNTLPSNLEWTHPAHAGAINRVKWNVPEFSHIFVTCSMDSTIKLWNIWSQLEPCLSVLKVHDKAVRDVDWNQTGRQLLSCSFDRTAKITDVETGVAVHSLVHRSFVTCGKYHPGQPSICITGEKDNIHVWDLRRSSEPCKTFGFKDAMGQVQDLVISQDDDTLFSCSDLISRDSSDRNMIAWDFKTCAPLSNQIYQERYTLTRLKVHPSDRTLLAQSYGNYIALFSLERPYKMFKNKRFDGHKLLGYSLGFDISPDGSSVYSGSSDGTIHCYNYQSSKRVRTIPTTIDVVMDVAIHPVLSSTVAVCGWDGTIQVWK